MAGYIGSKASVVSSGAERKKVFDITATTTSLTGCSYTPNQVHVFHNGVRLVDGTDYTATDGSTVTLTTAAQSGDEVVVVSYATFQTSDTVSASAGGTFTGDVAFSSKVGIGTTSPVDTFHAVGSDGATSRTTYQGATEFIFENNGDFSIDLSTGNADQAYINWHDTDAVQQGWLSYNHNGDYMRFGANGAERMRIDSSGNVGIGRTPDTVGTDTKTISFGGLNTLLGTTGTSGKQNFHTGLLYNAYANGTSQAAIVSSSGGDYRPAKLSMLQGQFIFYSSSSATAGSNISWSEHMRVNSEGKVYIGRSSDPYMSTGAVKRLSIDGGTTSTDATIVSNKNSASTMYHFYFHNSNSVVGSISTNSYATSFNTSSDYRLKENVVDITGAIERVNALSPKRFNWIDDEENKTVDGFLAHEAAAVVPEAITGTHNETQTAYGVVRDANGKVIAKDVEEEDWSANVDDLYPLGSTWAASEELPVYQSIDQSKLVPLLTAALQEALQKIDALEARVAALEAV